MSFTELKIDQSFVTGCSANAGSRIIVETGVEMARRLGITGFAEGVESPTDWNVVKAAGCDIAQGYYIAGPMDELLFADFCVAHAPAETKLKGLCNQGNGIVLARFEFVPPLCGCELSRPERAWPLAGYPASRANPAVSVN